MFGLEISPLQADPASMPNSTTNGGSPGSQLKAPAHVMYLIDHFCNIGGGEAALLKFIRHLPRHRFRASVATFRFNPLRHIEELGCPLHVFPMQRTYDWNAAKVAYQLRRLLRTEHVDIVHTFFETSNTWGGLVSKLGGGPLLVSSRRDMGILRLLKHRLAYALVNRLSDGVLAVSDAVRSFCVRHEGIDPRRTFTVYNGVELKRIDAAEDSGSVRKRLGLRKASPLITTVAHIRRVKGLDILVRTAGMVCREFPDAVFVVAGAPQEPDYLEELQRLISESNLAENVRFIGQYNDVYSLLKCSNIFFLPSHSEGFSNALIEAMACRLSCVATLVGGNAEAISDGENGFLVPAGDTQMAAERILRLLRNPDSARALGLAARRVVEEKFTAEVMGCCLADFYDTLLLSKR